MIENFKEKLHNRQYNEEKNICAIIRTIVDRSLFIIKNTLKNPNDSPKITGDVLSQAYKHIKESLDHCVEKESKNCDNYANFNFLISGVIVIKNHLQLFHKLVLTIFAITCTPLKNEFYRVYYSYQKHIVIQ